MPVIERIEVSDELLHELELAALAHGRSLAEEAGARIEEAVRREVEREELVARMKVFRKSLPPQTTDSLTLLREDRDR